MYYVNRASLEDKTMDKTLAKIAKLILALPEGGGREFVLPKSTVTLGRDTTNDILLYDPITLIAHSTGCLICRYYVERLGGKRKVGRLIMVGGPHSGLPRSLVNLLCKPDIVPLGILGEEGRQTLLSFPLMYQLLRTYECVFDNCEIHPVKQHHGMLYTDNDVKMRLKLELTK